MSIGQRAQSHREEDESDLTETASNLSRATDAQADPDEFDWSAATAADLKAEALRDQARIKSLKNIASNGLKNVAAIYNRQGFAQPLKHDFNAARGYS